MATPKKPTPKVKITGSASSSGGRAANTPSVTRGGSIAQSPKITGGKVAPKKPAPLKPKEQIIKERAAAAKRKPTPLKPKASAMPRGEAAAKQYQKEISPNGMAAAKAAQSKALDKKYPGLYKKKK